MDVKHIMNITISMWFSIEKDKRVRRYLGWAVESKESLYEGERCQST